MLTPSEVCVLIPAYNEEGRIVRLAEAVLRSGYRVVVSDDGSSDRTAEVARSTGAMVLTAPKNMGKGAALRRGFEYFLSGTWPALVMMDADGQHDPADLNTFLKVLDPSRAQLWIGDRMKDPSGMSPLRRLTNRGMSRVLSVLSGRPIADSQCGYRALTREGLKKIRLRTDRFEIESEMILEAARCGLEVKSVPVRCVYADEVSKIRPAHDTLRFLRFLAVHFLNNRRS